MNSATLGLETLHHLSEGLRDDFRQQIEAAVLDCKKRPTLPDNLRWPQ